MDIRDALGSETATAAAPAVAVAGMIIFATLTIRPLFPQMKHFAFEDAEFDFLPEYVNLLIGKQSTKRTRTAVCTLLFLACGLAAVIASARAAKLVYDAGVFSR